MEAMYAALIAFFTVAGVIVGLEVDKQWQPRYPIGPFGFGPAVAGVFWCLALFPAIFWAMSVKFGSL